jgi:hypothetical protein
MAGHGPSFAERLSKLRAMSAAEVVDRVRYRVVLALERRAHRNGSLTPPDRLERAVDWSVLSARARAGRYTDTRRWRDALLESRHRNRHRFLPGVRDRDAMRSLFEIRYRAELEDALAHAHEARHHSFEFFGQTFTYDADIDWQADPVSRRPWPASYHADVPVHVGNVGCGDVKHVWELSRQQFIIDLAKAHFLTGDTDALEEIQTLVRSWISANPYATGVNWACALEPAFRTFSWLWGYYLTVDSLDDDFHIEWLEAFYDHGRFLAQHLERYSSPYNHLMAEAAALYMLGACFPEFEPSVRWRALGRRVLERRLAEQFYSDGGSVEQSTFYHHATVGFLLLAALTARATGDELPPAIWHAIERGLDYSIALMQPDGSTPAIGGADDGKPIRMEHLPLWNFRPYHAIGAVLFARGDFKWAARRFYEDALWLLGPAGLEQFETLVAVPPAAASRRLEGSGYYVMRSGCSETADYVCIDCGEQAAGMRTDAVPNSMHGHADCLSVIVWLEGRPVLVDSGLFAYNCGGAWEAHFRETAAHNTARIDGRDQARHIGKMAWSHSYRARPEAWRVSDAEALFIGSHDGYARAPIGMTHRRAVQLVFGGALLIRDEFTGPAGHDIEVNFQFAPGDLAQTGERSMLFDRSIELTCDGNVAWTSETRCGGPEPQDGWMCRSLGVADPAPRLTFRSRSLQGTTVLETVLNIVGRVAPVRLASAGQTRDREVSVGSAEGGGGE